MLIAVKATKFIIPFNGQVIIKDTKALQIEDRLPNISDNLKTLLYGYCDADFAGDRSMRKSILGNVYFLVGRVILCLLKRQQIVVQFIIEVEYYALVKAISEVLQLKQIMGQIMYLGADIKLVCLYSDN